MKQGLSEIICIIDRSGSMGSIRNDAIGGFNTFLEEQQNLPGEAKMTLILFNEKYKIIYNGVPIKDIPKLNSKTYYPKGNTALLDAIGRAVDSVGERLSGTPESERPEKVIVAILTDGEENSSREYKLDQIKEKIEHQKFVYSWEFIFLAANQDAIQAGKSLGVSQKDSFMFVASSQGIQDAYRGMSNTVASYRGASPIAGIKQNK